jgi:hypothetical protein
MLEGIGLIRRQHDRCWWLGSHSPSENCFDGFGWQLLSDPQQLVLIGVLQLRDPCTGHTMSEEFGFGDLGQGAMLGRLPIRWRGNDFRNNNDLKGPSVGMDLKLSIGSPVVCMVVVADKSKHNACRHLMKDQT